MGKDKTGIMDSSIAIRLYQAEDYPHILKIFKCNTPRYFSPDEENDFIFYLKEEKEEYYVVEKDGDIIGSGGINFRAGNAGAISWDLLHPDYHGYGIGRQLLQYRISRLNALGIRKISVRTSQLVYEFYAKNGFRLVEIEKDYWAKGLDMYRMNFEE